MRIDIPVLTVSGTDAYTVSMNPTWGSLLTNQLVYLLFTNANTGAATLNPDSLGATPIKIGVVDVAVGDINAGQIIPAIYDGTNFQIFSRGNILSARTRRAQRLVFYNNF